MLTVCPDNYQQCLSVIFITHHKTLNEDSQIVPHYQRQECRPMTLVSGGIRFMRIFAEIPWGGASDDSGVADNGNFHWILLAISSDTFEMRPALFYYIAIRSPLSAF